MLLLGDVLKSASLWTSFPQDSLLGLLSTGEGDEPPISVGVNRSGMLVLSVYCTVSAAPGSAAYEETKRADKHLTTGIHSYHYSQFNVKMKHKWQEFKYILCSN